MILTINLTWTLDRIFQFLFVPCSSITKVTKVLPFKDFLYAEHIAVCR